MKSIIVFPLLIISFNSFCQELMKLSSYQEGKNVAITLPQKKGYWEIIYIFKAQGVKKTFNMASPTVGEGMVGKKLLLKGQTVKFNIEDSTLFKDFRYMGEIEIQMIDMRKKALTKAMIFPGLGSKYLGNRYWYIQSLLGGVGAIGLSGGLVAANIQQAKKKISSDKRYIEMRDSNIKTAQYIMLGGAICFIIPYAYDILKANNFNPKSATKTSAFHVLPFMEKNGYANHLGFRLNYRF